MAEARDAKFCVHVEYIKCYPRDVKLPPNGHGHSHVTRSFNLASHFIFGIGEGRHFKCHALVDTDTCMIDYHGIGCVQGNITSLELGK